MALTLSYSAIHQIIVLVQNDDRPTRKKKIARDAFGTREPCLPVLPHVNSKWKAIYELYTDIKPAPPLDYLNSFELALVLKDEVDHADVQAIFAHLKPLEFWGCPRLLVSKIIEAFRELQKEPECLDVTVMALSGLGATTSSDAWPHVYTTHVPCYECTAVEAFYERSIPHSKYEWSEDLVGAVESVIEKFHVSAKNFRKRLTLELHYQLKQGTTETEREQSTYIHKIAIRLTDETCSPEARLPAIANRSSATLLVLPEFACEVFGFLDRAHIGSSLLTNRTLHDLIGQLKQRLPVHHLRCAFEDALSGRVCMRRFTGAYWMVIRHVQRGLPYTDTRRFKMPSTAGADADCAVIRHYLSNSHVNDLRAPRADSAFAIKMLASLADRNCSVGRMKLGSGSKSLSDYRSMAVVFGEMRIRDLHLICAEHRFVELGKTTDFFRMSTVQRLRSLKLDLSEPWDNEAKPIGHARSKSPLWVSGVYLLPNCEYYRVDYRSLRHLRSIERRMVRICEDFERGEITDTVEHFHFITNSPKGMKYLFNRDNLLVSGMKVAGKRHRGQNGHFEWDVYRFRNASTSEYLTACVGQHKFRYLTLSMLHFVKGQVYPDASFADF